jgi:hypothetical protein
LTLPDVAKILQNRVYEAGVEVNKK